MLAIAGFVVVIGSIIGGYLMEGGHVGALWQPAELVIIGGAALGTMLIGNPPKVVKALGAQLPRVFKGSPYTRQAYMEILRLQFEVYSIIRKNGMLALESDVSEPFKSELFGKAPSFIKNHHAVEFFCDSLRLLIDGAAAAEVEQILMSDLATHHEETSVPPQVLSKVADALPGLGIVAAVMGIVIAMGALDGPASELGHKVAAALVGTFLGILLSYGFLQPLGAGIEHLGRDESKYFQCIMVGLVAFADGTSPAVAVEQARRVIYSTERPGGEEMNTAIAEIKRGLK